MAASHSAERRFYFVCFLDPLADYPALNGLRLTDPCEVRRV
ncbi:MAG: hypothetical protein ANABAC_3393 [Anaerolineae bacterium]|nr:MAG: hypothetical protein ANABAC_3393 [Anaerolineae bacterium]